MKMQRTRDGRLAWVLIVLGLVVGLSPSSALAADKGVAGSAESRPSPALLDAGKYKKLIQPFLTQHCVRCHGPQLQEGKLRLDTLPTNFTASESARHWIEIMDRINLGEMPPEKEPRPDPETIHATASWIAAELRNAARLSLTSGGRVLLRRMNRTEYANTVRDLLGITFLPGESPLDFLPPDGVAEGFDKVGAALMLDPSLLDKYFEVAARVADQAIVTGPPEFATYKKRYELEDTAKNGAINYLCSKPDFQCREQDAVLIDGSARSFGVFMYPKTKSMIPVKGNYTVRLRAAAFQGGRDTPVRIKIVRGDELLLETDVTAPPDKPEVFEVTLPLQSAGGQELEVRMLNGTRLFLYNPPFGQMEKAIADAGAKGDLAEVLRLRGRMASEGLISGGRPNPDTLDHEKLPKLYLDWIELEGPIYEQWPPKSHATLFFKGTDAKQDLEYAREIFTRFMPRAWRRPVEPAEVEPIVRLVKQELEHGIGYEDAIRAGLIAVLTSPKFLYLAEPAGEKSRPLTGYELASRLSYFVWSSMPDDELFLLARKGELTNPAVLQAQVDRMLADPKSQAFVNGFAAQWLRTGEYRNFVPDPRIYSSYDAKLGQAMVQETLTFFEEILRRDLSVLNFIDSDWTMLNDRLAKFYGIDGVKGEQFRRVTLPEGSHRGGLLGHAGVMLRGSDGTRTKPVRRGVYVREVLFNDPPDPPPPNVGEIEPNIQGKNLTVRDRLLQHQQIASCASCHRTIDPYGLALENYDAIGAWRTQQNGEEFRGSKVPRIDASGRLPNGTDFDGPEAFKKLLLEQKDRFAQGLTEKMMTYALGRPVEPSDRGTVDALAAQMAGSGYTLRSLIKSIVTSDAFLKK
jgi:mono/diheme cytochrome c family protein